MAETQRELAEYQTDHDLLIRVDQKVSDLIVRLDKNDEDFVTRAEFWPVKTLVYGCTGLILTTVIGALIYLVIKP
jgi:hypothetical protein